LESLFQSLYELENDKYILRGVNQFDKRKSEYRLNHKYIEVEIATNLLHSLLVVNRDKIESGT
jgi:hypothetical protein